MKRPFVILPLFAVLVFAAFAYDSSVKQFARVSAVPVGDGGMVACTHTAAPYCAWNSNQTGTYEIYGCAGNFDTGTFQCTGAPACLTCGKDATLFGYARAAGKGQPWFEPTNNKQINLWVSNPNYTTGRCAAPRPGSGTCGDLWVMNINITASGATLTNPNPACSPSSPSACLPNANITRIADPASNGGHEGGALFGRYGGGLLWLSYRFGDRRPGACVIGAWEVRAFHYTDTDGVFRLGPEVTAVAAASRRMFPCNYIEMSGFYDTASGEFTFEAAPSGARLWTNNIFGISASGTIDTLVPWGAGPGAVSDCPWNEHANPDSSGAWMIWSSSHGATAGSYNGCVAFSPELPLDKWMAPLTHPAPGHLGVDLSRAVRLTGFNVTGSPDRTFLCSVEGPCGTGPTARAFSGGYADILPNGQGVELVKHGIGNGTIFGFALKVH